ncbi:DUF1838 family protein [Halioxenophilus sp. WMMB6]|uniref:DUF1838 family protein n=1 Tax=Halioxenophilus sp. WMMB6 TaxID=3073815 RepID=UPI00295E7425|nr:DUF1838 family protein [Halioxenophilus sp. WMMB6]
MSSDKTDNKSLNRRDFLTNSGKIILGTGIAAAAVTQTYAMADAGKEGPAGAVDNGNLKYSDPYWNRDAMARLQADLDFGKQKFGWFSGVVNGVRANEKVKPLVGFEGFSFARLIDGGDGTYKKVLREIGFYTDLKTGEVLEEWENPYTNEKVRVVPIANDPFNYKISATLPAGPEYGGLNKVEKKEIPFILPWRETGDGKVLMRSYIHLFYPSALQPEKWPRESAGKMNRVSEMFSYVIDKDRLANPEETNLQYSGAWGRITPWLPWMLMGQAEGHCYYDCMMGGYHNMDVLSPKVRAYAEKHYPKYFEAPKEWTEPSLSSLELYAREQKPAPVKK